MLEHIKLDWMIDNKKVNLYDLRDILKKISDLERLINRIENKTCNYRDLISLFQSISQLEILKKLFLESPLNLMLLQKILKADNFSF